MSRRSPSSMPSSDRRNGSTRGGKLTASYAADVFARIKTGEAAARRDLRMRLVVERLTGETQDDNGFVSKDMQRGIDVEPQAFAAYEAESGTMVTRAGFILHNDLPVGALPRRRARRLRRHP